MYVNQTRGNSIPLAEKKTISLAIPAGIYEFYKDLLALDGTGRTPEQVFEEDIEGLAESTIDELPRQWFDRKKLIKKYGLQEIVNLPDC